MAFLRKISEHWWHPSLATSMFRILWMSTSLALSHNTQIGIGPSPTPKAINSTHVPPDAWPDNSAQSENSLSTSSSRPLVQHPHFPWWGCQASLVLQEHSTARR